MLPTKPTPIPESYRRVTPVLVVDGAVNALEFYSEVFGAAERIRYPGPPGTIAHAELTIGDSVVMIEDASPGAGTQPPREGIDGSSMLLFIYVENVDVVIDRALELGATLKRPPEDQFYGDRDGAIVDPFGHSWTIATHIEDVAPEEVMRRLEMLYQKA